MPLEVMKHAQPPAGRLGRGEGEGPLGALRLPTPEEALTLSDYLWLLRT